MKPALDQIFWLGFFSAAIHWLVARSTIAKPFWSRAHGFLAKLLACPACSGWWIGGALPWIGLRPLAGAPLWQNLIAGSLAGVILTPVFEGVLLWGLERSALPIEDTGTVAPEADETYDRGEQVTPLDRPRTR